MVVINVLCEVCNCSDFICCVEEVFGYFVEVIFGCEEVCLIYFGVVNSMFDSGGCWLVSDIGGGSIEFIIG